MCTEVNVYLLYVNRKKHVRRALSETAKRTGASKTVNKVAKCTSTRQGNTSLNKIE